MTTLIVDIETIGERWEDFDETTQDSLARWIDRVATSDHERQTKLEDLKNELGFSPLTGRVVALGVYDLERTAGTVYYSGDATVADEQIGSFWYRSRSEADMLRAFWDGVANYQVVVTFNGRLFDLPFILHRSIVHAVMPSIDLMRYRYLTQQQSPYHIDLADQLTFYGSMMKRPSLHLFCRAYGIESPKGHGVSGEDVARLYREGRVRDIAVYNTHDLLATALLYEKWQTYLAPPLFRKINDVYLQ